MISIYCVYKAIQKRNVVGRGQRSRFLVLTKRSAASGDENDVSLDRWAVNFMQMRYARSLLLNCCLSLIKISCFKGLNLRNRKHVPCFYRVIQHEWNFGRTRNAVGTRAAGECFHSFFEFSQTFTSVCITR